MKIRIRESYGHTKEYYVTFEFSEPQENFNDDDYYTDMTTNKYDALDLYEEAIETGECTYAQIKYVETSGGMIVKEKIIKEYNGLEESIEKQKDVEYGSSHNKIKEK